MADIIGLSSFDGCVCDLCGGLCDQTSAQLNALDCTFPGCSSALYHQECLEKHLRSIRCEKNRKTGFKCPRGCGKGTAHDVPCNGKITKSHPIQMQGDCSKKRKQVVKQLDTPAFTPMKPKMAEKKEESASPKAVIAQPKILVKAKTTAKPAPPSSASSTSTTSSTPSTPANRTQPAKPTSAEPVVLKSAKNDALVKKATTPPQQQTTTPKKAPSSTTTTTTVPPPPPPRQGKADPPQQPAPQGAWARKAGTAAVATPIQPPKSTMQPVAPAAAKPTPASAQQRQPPPPPPPRAVPLRLNSLNSSDTASAVGSPASTTTVLLDHKSSPPLGGVIGQPENCSIPPQQEVTQEGAHVNAPAIHPPPPPPRSTPTPSLISSKDQPVNAPLHLTSSNHTTPTLPSSPHAPPPVTMPPPSPPTPLRIKPTQPPPPPPRMAPPADPTSPSAARKLVNSWADAAPWSPVIHHNGGPSSLFTAGAASVTTPTKPPMIKAHNAGFGVGTGPGGSPRSSVSSPRQVPRSSLSVGLFQSSTLGVKMGGAHGGGGNGGGGIGATMSCGDKQQQQGDGRLVQAALEAIALRKTLQLAGRLRQVGFPEWACVAAVSRHGGDVEASLEYLMGLTCVDASGLEAAAADAASKPLNVDTSEERAALYTLASRSGVTVDMVARAVVDAGGDLDAVVTMVNAAYDTESTCSPSIHGTAPSSFTYSPIHEPPSSPLSGTYSPRAPGHMGAPSGPPAQGPQSPTVAGSPWLDDGWGPCGMGGITGEMMMGSGSTHPNHTLLSMENNNNNDGGGGVHSMGGGAGLYSGGGMMGGSFGNMTSTNQQAVWGHSSSMMSGQSSGLQQVPPSQEYNKSTLYSSSSTSLLGSHHGGVNTIQQQQQQQQESAWSALTTTPTTTLHTQLRYGADRHEHTPASSPYTAYSRGAHNPGGIPGGMGLEGVPQAALMAAAQVGSEAMDDLDVRGMMAALTCG